MHTDTSAAQLRTKQDAWCKAGAANKDPYPEDLEWEALVDVLRGKVKVNVHCYEAVDFDQLVSPSSEMLYPGRSTRLNRPHSLLTPGPSDERVQVLHRCRPPRSRGLPRPGPAQEGIRAHACGCHLCDV